MDSPRCKTITYDTFLKYQPGERIDVLTDPAIAEAARNTPLNVWTEVDCDGKLIIISGYHHVNREAYYLCKVPFQHGVQYEVESDDDDDLDDPAD